MSDTRATRPAPGPGPAPEPIRFFGTGWLTHDTGYWLRRVGVSAGALAATCAGALLMRLAVQGVLVARSGSLVDVLLTAAVAVCTVAAAVRSWTLFARGRAALSGWMAEERSVTPMLAIGFVGALAAYFVRSLVEAPGEAEKRARYERAQAGAAGSRPRAGAATGPGRDRR
ncbi:hypothetical protein [Streptacidiphilus sp. PB12-B1b]|uniref:hypothetical protein n=1 Tax=Streptacidiphilus sp. PB12-B1b TaxID=2705012 RepID=UPI0015FAAC23|nr:hypothetical protein [Streptacidiphilus sp. PB12-B1b]